MEVDVEDHLPLDEEIDLEDETVDGGVHGALDGVLDRDEGQRRTTAAHGLEGLGERGGGNEVGGRVVGLGEQGLFGEGPRRSEEADRARRSC